MKRELRHSADRHYDTGELDQSIDVVAVGNGPRYRLHAKADTLQAITTDRGARPHVIRPRRPGGMLTFYWPKAGRVVSFRHVNHPGNKGSGWWRKTMRSNVLRRAMRKAARKVA